MGNLRYKLYYFFRRIFNKLKLSPYTVRFIFKSRPLRITEGEVLQLLSAYHPDNGKSSIRNYPVKKNILYDVQIIVPVFNVEKYLDKCLESLINQEFTGSYVITIVNDGSTDRSVEILKKYENNSLCEIIHKENGGLSSARNKALENIKGKYLYFVDSDDFIPSNALQNLFSVAENSGSQVVYGPYQRVDSNNEILSTYFPRRDKIKGCIGGKLFDSSLFDNLIFPDKYWFEDIIVSMIIGAKTLKFSYINDIIYYYRDNFNGISRKAEGNLKMIDTLYGTKRMLDDIVNSGRSFTEYDYDIYLEQVRMNRNRIETLKNNEINKLAFYFHCLMSRRFKGFSTKDRKLKFIEWALNNNNYAAYNLGI